MGLGRFKNGKFDLVVVANFAMTSDDWTAWEKTHKKASEILYNASEGQMQFGKIFVCDDSIGLDVADFILHPSGDPSYSPGKAFGVPGSALHLMPYVCTRGPLTILHEMGHYVWGLGEEYSTPLSYDDIDKTNPAPDKKTIPIKNATWSTNELVTLEADAILSFPNSTFERHNVIANSATAVTVDSDYSDLPTNSTEDLVAYQFPAECSVVSTSNYCIMENSRDAAGYFDDFGNWVNDPNPVTEYCTSSNHDPDSDTMQESAYMKSCWEVMLDHPQFSSLTLPDPAGAGPTTGSQTPEWIILDKQPRFALVLDRSYSMHEGTKMDDTKTGAVYWLEYCAESNDRLAIIWYNQNINTILDLTVIASIPDLNSTINDINALTPSGNTNIRDGLYEALDQIESLASRAATQVTLLLSDGLHNRPIGSKAGEVIPDFQESGVRIYAIGVGDQSSVDMDTLDDLALETGGRSYSVGDSAQLQIQTRMAEINLEVRGGIITTLPIMFPDSQSVQMGTKRRRRSCEEIIKILEIDPLNAIEGLKSYSGPLKDRFRLIPVQVEEQCSRASFTLIYPKDNEIHLCLLNPKGQLVNMDEPNIHHVISDSPHEFAIVEQPAAGRWHMLAFRPKPGPNFTARAMAGGENIHLQVFGDVVRNPPLGTPVRIWASARWKDELSGLRVTATVIFPNGSLQHVVLSDDKHDEPNSGLYEGYITPQTQGRYRVIIQIENKGNAIIANPNKMILHTDKMLLSLKSSAPPFMRSVICYFDYGQRPPLRDRDKDSEGRRDNKL
jgi:uncharacterized protein YegL